LSILSPPIPIRRPLMVSGYAQGGQFSVIVSLKIWSFLE